MGKVSSESWANRGLTTPSKPLVAIGEPQCDSVSTKNDRSNKKTRIFRPQLCVWVFSLSICFEFQKVRKKERMKYIFDLLYIHCFSEKCKNKNSHCVICLKT